MCSIGSGMSKTPWRWNARWGSCASRASSTATPRSSPATPPGNISATAATSPTSGRRPSNCSMATFSSTSKRTLPVQTLPPCSSGADSPLADTTAGSMRPNVDYTAWRYDRRKLRLLDDDLLEVPQTDCTCWAISREVLDRLPPVDPHICKFGWGIYYLTITAARALNKPAVRDYRFTVCASPLDRLRHRRGGSAVEDAAPQPAAGTAPDISLTPAGSEEQAGLSYARLPDPPGLAHAATTRRPRPPLANRSQPHTMPRTVS